MSLLSRSLEILPPSVLALLHYVRKHRRLPRLFPPVTFNEHIVHRLMFDRDPLLHTLCDKVAVKAFIAERVGPDYAVPLLGAWTSISQIRWDDLPENFVLKPSYSSGPFEVVGPETDRAALAKRIEDWLPRRLPHWHYAQWGYLGVPRRIIAEPLLTAPDGGVVIEVDVYVFRGRTLLLRVLTGRKLSKERRDAWFDRDGRQLAIGVGRIAGRRYDLPEAVRRELIEASEAAAKGFSSLRVDFYISSQGLKIGELTPYSWGAGATWRGADLDEKMGALFAPGADTSLFEDYRDDDIQKPG